MLECQNGPEAPIVIYVSKMVLMKKKNVMENGLNEYVPEEG